MSGLRQRARAGDPRSRAEGGREGVSEPGPVPRVATKMALSQFGVGGLSTGLWAWL